MKRNAFGQLIPASPYLRFFATTDENLGGGDGKEFKAPASQEELDRIVTARAERAARAAREEERSKFSDYETVKADAEKFRAAQNGQKTPDEKLDERLTAAEQRAQQAEENANKLREELLSERVQSTFKSAANGRALTPDAVFAFDPKSFVNDGAVDTDAIKEWVEKHSTEVKPAQQKVPGQGDRDANAAGGSVQSGRDLYDSQKKPRKD